MAVEAGELAKDPLAQHIDAHHIGLQQQTLALGEQQQGDAHLFVEQQARHALFVEGQGRQTDTACELGKQSVDLAR